MKSIRLIIPLLAIASFVCGLVSALIASLLPFNKWIESVFGWGSILLFLAVVVATLLGVVVAFVRRDFKRGLLTGLLGIVCGVGLMVANGIAMLCFMFADPDHFADDLTLPTGVALAEPVPYTDEESLRHRVSEPVDGAACIQLYKGFQGGIYEADVWCNPQEPGHLYLKAFEITRAIELSGDAIRECTTQSAKYGPADRPPFLHQMSFTVYEGNWGQYYGARIEVWFKPDGPGQERKLLEKNFKIEGWMR